MKQKNSTKNNQTSNKQEKNEVTKMPEQECYLRLLSTVLGETYNEITRKVAHSS